MTRTSVSITATDRRVSRRQFLKVAGRVGLTAAGMTVLGACEGQPAITSAPSKKLETTAIRLVQIPGICVAPQYLAEDIMKSEGFTDVLYVKEQTAYGTSGALASGEADINMSFAGPLIMRLDAHDPIVILAGVHVGCFELFANNPINAISDLRGKTVAVLGLGATDHIFLSSILAYVGLDPKKDVNWISYPAAEAILLFAAGKIDAYLAFPPTAQELHARKIGRVILNSMADKPWSNYFCCMVAANRDFAQKNPVATKRALRAILKASDICALQPELAARFMVDKGYAKNYDYALAAMRDVPYNRWREYDATDALRFYALRLHEAGMIKSSPDEIIAATNWRFLNEIKKETTRGSSVSMLPGWADESQAMSEHFRPASSAAKLRNLFSCFLTSS
jgi:NitT/TauT family transport system substrate-binding protein